MPSTSIERWLSELEQRKTRFDPTSVKRVAELLRRLDRTVVDDTTSLIWLHEILLFIRAFPHGPAVFRQTGYLLDNFITRVERLRAAGIDLSALEPLEISGIAGTVIEDTLSYDVVRWLANRFPDRTEIVWDGYEQERLMANAWPRFIPLLEEDSAVEANIPWRQWLREAGSAPGKDLAWLLRRFERLPVSAKERSESYDGLQMVVRWTLDNLKATRTRNWRNPGRIYYHRGPLIQRRDVSLAEVLALPPATLEKLSERKGREVLDLVHEVMAVRYRELYGTTLGDSRQVHGADLGRGVQMYLWGLPPERRLPLRAYLAGMTLKNGVPINYVEAISLFEWSEVGFNTFYTFRDGETAWIYAQALRIIRQLHRVLCFSIYPYQLGHGNEEAIESGAYWFYRKLGFRPGKPELARLSEREEKRIAVRRGYRTSMPTLRRLAAQHLFYELPGAEPGAWDRFSTRQIGFTINRQMAREYGGDATDIRLASLEFVAKALRGAGSNLGRLSREPSRKALEELALVFALIPDLPRWNIEEKRKVIAIIQAKAGPEESRYIGLLQEHRAFRSAVLKLGSSPATDTA